MKYKLLLEASSDTFDYTELQPREPLFLFTPARAHDSDLRVWPLSAVFGTGNPRQDRNKTYAGGFKTRQDSFTVAFDTSTLRSRITELADGALAEADLRQRYRLCSTAHFDFAKARQAAKSGQLDNAIRRMRYRPFDDRPMIWAREVLCEPQSAITRHLLHPNLCLATSRVVKDDAFRHVTVARGPVEVIALSNSTSTNAYMFPLYRYEPLGVLGAKADAVERLSNISPHFVRDLADAAFGGMPADPNAREAFDPARVFDYVYAILHSSGYRTVFADELLRDFPPIPIPRDGGLLIMLEELGDELVSLHLLEAAEPGSSPTSYVGPRDPEIGRVAWSDNTVWLNAGPSTNGEPATAGTIGFRGVPVAVWNLRVGNYQVCEKWLKDRKGRTLTQRDVEHYKEIVAALTETMRVMSKIDETIEQYGGWPEAFVTSGPLAELTEAEESVPQP